MRELIDCPRKCARGRHFAGHPHLDETATPPEKKSGVVIVDDGATVASVAPSNVTGAGAPQELADQARAAIAEREKRSGTSLKSKELQEKEALEAQITATRPLARRLAIVPYSAIALATFDDRWRISTKEEIDALEQATLMAMLAWGIEFSGKWSSVSALVLCHAEIMANKAKMIWEQEKQKKRNAVTDNPPAPTQDKVA